jgi:hypothetical protein
MKKVLLFMSVLALTVEGANTSYHFTLHEPATLNGTQLKPGDYRVEVEGDKGRIRVGKTVVEAPVKIETSKSKFKDTFVNFNTSSAGLSISEIDIGGSTTRIIFGASTASQ